MDTHWPTLPPRELADEKLVITDLSIGRMRLLQNPDTLEIVAADTAITDVISNSHTDKQKGETDFKGPMTGKGMGVIWENNVMTLYAMQIDTAIYQNVIKHLESIEIKRNNE